MKHFYKELPSSDQKRDVPSIFTTHLREREKKTLIGVLSTSGIWTGPKRKATVNAAEWS